MEQLLVRDLLAVQAPRTHELAPGKRFDLKADEDTSVPHDLANRLVGIDGFAVFLPDGTRIQNVETKDSAGNSAMIRADQVIADLTELSQDALVARCAIAAPERKFHIKSSKREMIDTLIRKAGTRAKSGSAPAAVEVDYSVDGDAGAFEAVPEAEAA